VTDELVRAPRWVAFTPKEGKWMFTASPTPEQAMNKLRDTVNARQALCHPIDNPVTAVRIDDYKL
jgi:hypothetical protein